MNLNYHMKKSYMVVALMLSILVVSGCKKEEKKDVSSRIDLTNPVIVEMCDKDGDGEISAEELTVCEVLLTTSGTEDVVGDDNTQDNDEAKNEDNNDSSAKSVSRLLDVRADYPGGYVIYDSKTGVAEMSIEGELMYIDIEGNYTMKADGVWTTIKGYGDGGFYFPEFNPENTKTSPLMIPYANMPYIFTYEEVLKLAQGKTSKCGNGDTCEEFVVDGPEGIVNLRFNSEKLLVELFVDDELVKYTHGRFDVKAPNGQSVQDFANSLM